MSASVPEAPPAKRPRTMSNPGSEEAHPTGEMDAAPAPSIVIGPDQLPKRHWKGSLGGPASGFKVVSYNILAPSFATSFSFPCAPIGMLEWNNRWPLIQAQLEVIDADLVCLQEVEKSHYEPYLVPYFEGKGYKGCSQFGDKKDRRGETETVVSFGTATFWRESTFEALDGGAVKSLAMKTLFAGPDHKGKLLGTPPPADISADCWPENPPPASSLLEWTSDHHTQHKWFWSWFFSMHHGGGAVTLKHKGTGKLVIAGNFHALANKHESPHKALQVALVAVALDNIHKALAGQDVSIVLAGDFNSTPTIRADKSCEDVEAVLAYQDNVMGKGRDTVPGLSVSKTAPAATEGAEAALTPVELSLVPTGTYHLLTTGSLETNHPHHAWEKKGKRAPRPRAPAAKGGAGAGDAAAPAAAAVPAAAAATTTTLHPSSVPEAKFPLRFVSAYAEVQGREPAWSNAHDTTYERFKETLDYIFVATASRELKTEPVPGEEAHAARKWVQDFLARKKELEAAAAAAAEAAATAASGDGAAAAPKPKAAPLPIVGLPFGHQVVAEPWTPIAASELKAAAVLEIPCDEEVSRFEGGADGCCPNAGQGSDHIPLAAYFEWK